MVPRCGDHVLHRPTGEKWVVAYADEKRDELAWAGWPVGTARLSDCELVHRVSSNIHAFCVHDWLVKPKGSDPRRAEVQRLYGGVLRAMRSGRA